MTARHSALLASSCFALAVLLPGAAASPAAAATPLRVQQVPGLPEAGSAPTLGEPVPGYAPQLDEPGSAPVLGEVDPSRVAVLREPVQGRPAPGVAEQGGSRYLLAAPPGEVLPVAVGGGGLVLATVLLVGRRRRLSAADVPAR